MTAADHLPPQGYPTLPRASAEVRGWFRQQILGAHYVIQGKGFEALTREEQRKLVLRDCARILDSVVLEMTDRHELELREEAQGDVFYPGPSIPDHPCSPRGGRVGRNLGAPLGKAAPARPSALEPEPAPELPERQEGDIGCPNCGTVGPFWGPRAVCRHCKATITWDASGYLAVEIDPVRERELFIARHGLTPEAEVDRVRSEGMDWSPAGLQRYYRASLLERREKSAVQAGAPEVHEEG